MNLILCFKSDTVEVIYYSNGLTPCMASSEDIATKVFDQAGNNGLSLSINESWLAIP